jgi:hypothetical protein
MTYTKEQLIDALVAEYEYLCHDDFNPDTDPTPEEYRGHLEYLEYDELIEEINIGEEYTLEEYMINYGQES